MVTGKERKTEFRAQFAVYFMIYLQSCAERPRRSKKSERMRGNRTGTTLEISCNMRIDHYLICRQWPALQGY